MDRPNINRVLFLIIATLLLCTYSSNLYAAEVTLTWTAPDDSRVVGYNIYCGESGTEFTTSPVQSIDSADQTSCLISGLEEGQMYDFAATSRDANGNESDFSETVSYQVASDTVAPEDIDDDGDGYTENQGDCNDTDPQIFPGAAEICGDGIDQDCDGSDLTCPEDVDNDGDGYTENEGDCNDSDPAIHPGASEICGDGIDQNCSGSDLTCPEDIDDDGDGYTENQGDCNDSDASIHPNAAEICGDGIDQDCTNGDLACAPDETADFVFETGETQISHEWKTITFEKAFENPVVVAKPIGLNDGEPAVIRIKNVTPTGFEMRIQEWEYQDGSHMFENVGYMVMEAGNHELQNGIQVEAGSFETSSSQAVNFSQAFSQKPVVACCVTTENEADAVTGRIHNISTDGFDFLLQEQESHKSEHFSYETVSYIAWEPSSGTVDGLNYIVDSTFDDVTHDAYGIDFYPAFANAPLFVADMQTRDGGDTANVRWQNKNASGIEVLIDEEQSKDSEISHTTEVVGYMAFEKKTSDTSVTAIFGGTPDGDHPGTVQDTFININNEVNDTSAQLNTYTWPSKTPANAILIKFDLSALPEGAQIQSATLQLYQTKAKGDDPYTVSVHRVINHNPDLTFADGYTYDVVNSWTANDESYKGIPLAQADIAPAEDANDLDQVSGYKEWNVTGMVQGWVSDPNSNYGLMLNSDVGASANSYRYFASADAMDSAARPKLKVIYTVPTQTAIFGDTPDADYSGTIQDTFININNEVNASSEQLNTYTWPENTPANAVLLKMDLSDLPEGAQIQSATLSLYQAGAGGDAAYDVAVHKIINHNPDLYQANGYTFDSANAWTANETCYNSIPLAQADIAAAEDVNTLEQSPGYKQWDVTGMTHDWAENPNSNFGLLLNSDTVAASDSYRFFAATETINAAQRPRLTITYTISNDNID